MEAFDSSLADGTYELVGPKIQGNPEKHSVHTLVKHNTATQYAGAPRTFDGIAKWLRDKDVEGIVWHRSNGDMAKIKKRDFNQKRI